MYSHISSSPDLVRRGAGLLALLLDPDAKYGITLNMFSLDLFASDLAESLLGEPAAQAVLAMQEAVKSFNKSRVSATDLLRFFVISVCMNVPSGRSFEISRSTSL